MPQTQCVNVRIVHGIENKFSIAIFWAVIYLILKNRFWHFNNFTRNTALLRKAVTEETPFDEDTLVFKVW